MIWSDYFALMIATDMIESLVYKLRHFGILVEGPADIYFENMSVLNNSSIPTSELN